MSSFISPRIKICGITRLEDALCAADLGAWAVGFVFHEASPRYLSPEEAAAISRALPCGLLKFGVFAGASRKRVETIAAQALLDVIQFHGDERPESLTGHAQRTVKALRPTTAKEVEALASYTPSLGFLIDSRSPGRLGGTGQLADWKLAIAAKAYGPVILAGGIRAGNIARALREVAPYAIDVSSSVETSPGIKSALLMKDLFAAARAASPAAAPNPRFERYPP